LSNHDISEDRLQVLFIAGVAVESEAGSNMGF